MTSPHSRQRTFGIIALATAALLLVAIPACRTRTDRATASQPTAPSDPAPFTALRAAPVPLNAAVVLLDSRTRLRAMATSWFYGSGQNASIVETWLHETGIPPLLLIDPEGDQVRVSASSASSNTVEVSHTNGLPEWLNWSGPTGKVRARIGTFGVPPPPNRTATSGPPPGVPLINHLNTLPSEAHLVHGIAWAYASLPDLTQTQAYALREQLGLVVPEATRALLVALFGEGRVYRSTVGDVMIEISSEGTAHYFLVESYWFGYEPLGEGRSKRVRLGAESPGKVGRWRQVQVIGSHDPPSILRGRNLNGGPSTADWTLIAESWADL